MEGNDAITTLEVLRANCSKHSRDYQALEYAINSLKTDETYQLMYEGEEIYTKADMADMLEELNSEIRKLHVRQADQLDAGLNIGVTRCSYLIQQKIDKLRGKENEK